MTNHEQCNLGWELIDEGKGRAAAEHFSQVLARDRNYSAALHGMGWLQHLAGEDGQAEALISRAVQIDPKRAIAHFRLGIVYVGLRRSDRAIACVRRAVALEGSDVEYRAALATLLEQRGQLREAERVAREALQLEPRRALTLAGLAHTFCVAGDPETGAECARRAIALEGGVALGHAKLGYALLLSNDPAGAEAALRRAMELDPNHAKTRVDLAMALLAQGRMADAWEHWEWRLRIPHETFAPQSSAPTWNGVAHANQTVVVHAEQGYGDSIQFGRFLSEVAERGMRVVVRAPEPIVPLLRGIAGVAEAIVIPTPPPDHQSQISMMSLPGALGLTGESLGACVPYVKVDGAKKEEWRQRLKSHSRPKLRVGLAWAGNPKHQNDHNRSIPSAAIAPLFDVAPNDIGWVSLQIEKRGPLPPQLADFSADVKNFADTAALVEHLDLVISVDTATAHLAGALGKPVWTLLPWSADWRWMVGREDSPWYPTMRLFRQQRRGEWAAVISEVASQLTRLAETTPVA